MKLKGIELKGTYKVVFGNYCFKVYYKNGNGIYLEDSDGDWFKREYDENNNEIYYEDSGGTIVDKRAKELTVEEIEALLGYKIKIKGENKWKSKQLLTI